MKHKFKSGVNNIFFSGFKIIEIKRRKVGFIINEAIGRFGVIKW
jgi:hypothetical protein